MKIKNILFFLTIGWTVTACQNEPEIPQGTISEEKMVQIQTDIHLLEARISKYAMMSMDSATLVTEHLKQQIFKKYKTDSAAYNRSYQFYSTNPVFMERIYEKVTKTLEARQKKKNYQGI
jgi:hypothetical protein